MINKHELLHLGFIESVLKHPIAANGVLEVGNNLNEYLTFQSAESYVQTLRKSGTDREQKSSTDVYMGRIAEEVLIYLLNAYFTHNKKNYIINFNRQDDVRETIKIVNEKLGHEKRFDIDIVITKEGNVKKYFLISCKGTARERIGQFLSNLFLMDARLIKEKYSDRYYLPFHQKGIQIKYGFVCYDWAKDKDFFKYTPTGRVRRTLKQTEVHLINDDGYISGGVTVLNNLENLDGVSNFGELVGKIGKFLN